MQLCKGEREHADCVFSVYYINSVFVCSVSHNTDQPEAGFPVWHGEGLQCGREHTLTALWDHEARTLGGRELWVRARDG